MEQADNSVIPPGQSRTFIYVGNMIPAQALIQNLSPGSQADYRLKSGPQSWTYFGNVPAGHTQSIYVEWPTNIAVFTNTSGGEVNIRVYGNGIRPATADEAKAHSRE